MIIIRLSRVGGFFLKKTSQSIQNGFPGYTVPDTFWRKKRFSTGIYGFSSKKFAHNISKIILNAKNDFKKLENPTK